MNSSNSWLVRLWLWLAARFFRLREIDTVLARTQERYLDVAGWAAIRGIPERKAQQELLDGVKLGHLEKCLLYEWSDAPTRFVLPESYVGKLVRLSDIGYIGEDDWREIEISPNRVRTVFISATD